jgi:predicted O-methyltransferase YrrM
LLPHRKDRGNISPYLYRLIHEVFAKDIDKDVLLKIENYRNDLLSNNNFLKINDFGAKGQIEGVVKKISSVALHESIPLKYGKLLYNLVCEHQPENILELGTSLGVSSYYMALAASEAKIYSLEGSVEKAQLATLKLSGYGALNVKVISGSFEERLTEALEKMMVVDFAFLDGNHQKEPTLRYFNEIIKYCSNDAVLVLDDINWSAGMMEAWETIKKHPNVYVSLDLFRMGIIFVNPKLQKQHFTIFY